MTKHYVYPIKITDESTKQVITINIFGDLTINKEYLEITLNTLLVFKLHVHLLYNHAELITLIETNHLNNITTHLKHNKL